MDRKKKTSFSMSEKAKELLIKLSNKLSISQSAVLEIAVREKAKSEKVE